MLKKIKNYCRNTKRCILRQEVNLAAYCKCLKLSFCLNQQTEHKGESSEKKTMLFMCFKISGLARNPILFSTIQDTVTWYQDIKLLKVHSKV